MTVSTRVCCSIISLTQVPYAVTDRRGSSVDGDGDGDGGDAHAARAEAVAHLLHQAARLLCQRGRLLVGVFHHEPARVELLPIAHVLLLVELLKLRATVRTPQ